MILAQDGYGPTKKIEEGILAGYLDGVIFSTKYRKPNSLHQTIASFSSRYPEASLFLDTHFYASQIAMTKPGRVEEYQLYKHGLTRRDFSAKNINNYARGIVDYQRRLGLSNIILPGLTLSNFDDSPSFASLQLFEASLDYLDEIGALTEIDAYPSLVFSESALLDNEKLSEYLDEITILSNVKGFYIIVEKDSSGSPHWQDSRKLSKLMYIVKTLSENFEVICGFTDFPGMLLLSVGAKHVASGWHGTLRKYTGDYFLRRSGRNRGTFRYASRELLTQLLSIPDLQSIINKGLSSKYVDSQYGGGLIDPDSLTLPPLERVLHQWKVFREIGDEILSSADSIGKIEELLHQAKDNLEDLDSNYRVTIDQSSVMHYEVWQQSIETFRSGVL